MSTEKLKEEMKQLRHQLDNAERCAMNLKIECEALKEDNAKLRDEIKTIYEDQAGASL
jgi:FtsZ-binding cell division protein ZapB